MSSRNVFHSPGGIGFRQLLKSSKISLSLSLSPSLSIFQHWGAAKHHRFLKPVPARGAAVACQLQPPAPPPLTMPTHIRSAYACSIV